MKAQLSKIRILLIGFALFHSCDAVKRVPKNDHLLTQNNVIINGKKNKTETIDNLLLQKTNRKLLGVPLRLHIYNLARPNIDSIVNANINKSPKRKRKLEKLLSKKQLDKYVESRKGFNNWLKNTGEPPVIVDETKTKKSLKNLTDYHFNNGWFDAKATYNIEKTEDKRAEINYQVTKGAAYVIDSISTQIKSPIVDSLYTKIEENSFIKKGEQYKTTNFEAERNRISEHLRNSGVYHFSTDYVTVEIDTIGTNKKVNVNVQIQDRAIRTPDSTRREDFKIYKIKDVNIYANTNFSSLNETVTDSAYYKGYNLYSIGKMKFNPEALTDAVFIKPRAVFKDIDRIRTYRYISELRTFKYPDIKYIENADATLTANVYLTPLKKFNLGFNTDVSTSNIQSIGFSVNPSLLIRNIFKGAETFEISAIGAIGSSKNKNNIKDNPFFDINEIGLNLKLTIPRIFSPFNTDNIIPNYMSPSTRISLASTSQTNIGLDKQTLIGSFNYNWLPSNKVTNRLDLFNVQYVRNLNVGNYFNVYENSFDTLKEIAEDINYVPTLDIDDSALSDAFIDDVLNENTPLASTDTDYKTVSAINERKERLTENNLIFSSSFNFIKNTQENLFDETFSIFRYKIELAGNLLANTSKLLGLTKDDTDRYEIFDVAFSQYAKTEIDYIKHWDLGKKNVLALRSFLGVAIPYGNSNNIPFAKSFFAGGANDNRAWTAYSLGPGSSITTNEFNEANLKLALSVEQRFNLFGSLNGAIFMDAGNIWNVLDNTETGPATFDGVASLKDIAVGSGFGLRYDFSFFIFRFDIGFKTYDPSYQDKNRWFNDYNFTNAVYNIGINYPF